MTFLPASESHATVFSDTAHRHEAALVRPSLAFWHWLTSSNASKGWQLRGGLGLQLSELAPLIGPELAHAVAAGSVQLDTTSIWSGAGGTRTPLHVDMVHALVFQVAGTKRWLLAPEAAVEAACDAGDVPEAVLTNGETHDFLVEGSLKDLYGVDDSEGEDAEDSSAGQGEHVTEQGVACVKWQARATSKTVRGRVVTLREGDCLLVPAGLYHDVQSDTLPALSLTVRFSLAPFACPQVALADGGTSAAAPCGRPCGHWGAHACDGGSADNGPKKKIIVSQEESSPQEALTPKLLFQRWRQETRQDESSTNASAPNKSNCCKAVEPDSRKRLFEKWRDATGPVASDDKGSGDLSTAPPLQLQLVPPAVSKSDEKEPLNVDEGRFDVDD